jgi:signal transduction histidine kinase
VIAKTQQPWQAPDDPSGMPLFDLLHEPAARQALDALLAIQMQLELATGVPVAIYDPTGQPLPGISPIKPRLADQQTPPIKDLLNPQQWPQSSGQLFEVIEGARHFCITPLILRGIPIAQVILGPFQLFEPGAGAQDGRAERTELPGKMMPAAGVPVLASWKAQAVAALARTLVSSLSRPAIGDAAREERQITTLPLSGNGFHHPSKPPMRLGALAQDAILPEKPITAPLQRVIESTSMIQPPEDHNLAPAWPAPPRPLSLNASQTEHRDNEASLLRHLIAAMPQAVILSAAPDGHIVLANRAARKLWPHLLGLQGPGEETSAPSSPLLSADDYPPEWLGLSIALRQARAFRGEVSVETGRSAAASAPAAEQAAPAVPLASEPTRRPLLVSAFPLRAAQGMVSHAVAIFEDVSGLLERERFKEELLQVAAHQIRNPLTVISSYAQLLGRNLAMEIPPGQGLERARGRLAEIQEQVHLLTDLTSQLSIMTQLQRAGQSAPAETVNLALLLQRCVIDQKTLTPGRTIEIAIERDPCPVQGDQFQLQQVCMRLLQNAVSYSHPGKPIRVSLRCIPGDKPLWAEIMVRDQGIGIPRADLPHLFERFYRVIGSEQRARVAGIRRPNSEAISLGGSLYLCKQLIERMGGRIWAESVEGQGTTVSFRVPLSSGARAPNIS